MRSRQRRLRYINVNTDIINMFTFMYAIIYVFTAKITVNRKYVGRKNRIFLLSSKLCNVFTLFVYFWTFLYYYHWVDTSAGGLLISQRKIRTVVSSSTLTLFIIGLNTGFFLKLSMYKLRQLTPKLNKVRRTLCKVFEWAAGVYTYILS